MSKRIAVVFLSLAALGACSTQGDVASVDRPCAAIASTGDMYRYCLEVGPEQAVLDVDGPAGVSQTATALTTGRRH